MGMMPKDEIKIEKVYKDSLGLKIIIQAGDHGWSILFADCSSIFKDVDDTPENNFEAALSELKTHISDIEED
jgi:pyruvate formate-lyase activating enzyme-like uncharacterized protein